jgi:hypothetical protein
LDADSKKLRAVVGGSGDERNRNRDDDHRRWMMPMQRL